MSSYCQFIVLSVCFLLPSQAAASFAELPLHAALAHTDLVVVATLRSPRVVANTRGGTFIEYEGVLRVHRHLGGDHVEKHRSILAWTVDKRGTGEMDHGPAVGKKGIWLLQRAKRGRYTANHPQLYRPLTDLAAMQAALKGPLYAVDTRSSIDAGKACCITVVIKTFQPRLEVRDFISVKAGAMRLHGKAQIEVQGQSGTPLKPAVGCLLRAAKGQGPEHVVVTKKRPHRVTIDLRKCFSLKRAFSEVFHFKWGNTKENRSLSYIFQL